MVAILFLVVLAVPTQASEIGASVPDFSLLDSQGRRHRLAEHTESGKTVLLYFWSFKCPVSLAQDRVIAALQEEHDAEIQVLGVASSANESESEIRRNVENLGISFPILLDRDGQLAERLRVQFVPSVLLIDPAGVLRYRGAIESLEGKQSRQFLHQALRSLLSGQPVRDPETRAFGCTLRRVRL